jgi:hypothetical protein
MIINIKGQEYRIEVKELEDKYGECDTENRIISLDPNNINKKEETIYHEIFHAVLSEVFVDSVVEDTWLELIVSNLALEAVKIKHNKQIEDFINGK